MADRNLKKLIGAVGGGSVAAIVGFAIRLVLPDDIGLAGVLFYWIFIAPAAFIAGAIAGWKLIARK